MHRSVPSSPGAADSDLAIPNLPGTYALVLASAGGSAIRIGALGYLLLDAGCYIYVGSACGPGGLRARIRHHRGVAQRPHWHVDYLRRHARLESVWYIEGRRREHRWAALFAAMPGAFPPMAGFGSSDCRCPAHLFRFAAQPSDAALRRALGDCTGPHL